MKLDNIIATNFVSEFVSFNEIEVPIEVQTLSIEVEEEKEIEEVIQKEEKSVVEEKKEEDGEVVETKEEIQVEEQKKEEIPVINSTILYDNLSEEDLILKLEKSLKNELSGTGSNFVEYYKSTGLDPYLAVAIVLHETGCTWKCSSLVRECYNYGGMKGGGTKYKDTNYTCYSSKEEGINAYLNMLYNNYYAKGLTTPELINPKYASSLEWSVAVNKYIDKIKNNI